MARPEDSKEKRVRLSPRVRRNILVGVLAVLAFVFAMAVAAWTRACAGNSCPSIGELGGYDPNQALLAIQDGKPAYLKTTHAICRLLRGLIFKNVLDAGRHDFADCATVRWISLRRCAKRNIPVGDHSNQPVIFTNRKRPAVNLRHQGSDLFNRIVR